MACGKLVQILLTTKVTRYLEWQVVEGTYVYQFQKAGFFSNAKYIHKVSLKRTPSEHSLCVRTPVRAMLARIEQKETHSLAIRRAWPGCMEDTESVGLVRTVLGLEEGVKETVATKGCTFIIRLETGKR